MTQNIESVKNYLQWNKADWRAYFRTHGQRIVRDYQQYELDDIPSDVRRVIWSRAFEGTMVKVGIFGGSLLFDQIPSRWNTEINSAIPHGNCFGFSEDFTSVRTLATRLILDRTDMDEGVLIKFSGQEPLFLLRLGPEQWIVEKRDNGNKSLVHHPEKFVQASELIDSAQEREELEQHFSREPILPPPLVQLVAGYVSEDRLILDQNAMQKRKMCQQVCEIINADLRDPIAPGVDTIRERDACRIVSALFVNTELEGVFFQESKTVEASWAATLSQIWSSLCNTITTFINWCLSLIS